MSILKIGRAFDTYDVDAVTASWAGKTLTLAGDVYLSTVTASDRPEVAAAMRDRFLALTSSSDEPVVPVVWSEDSSVDGFYRPIDSRVNYSPASLNDGYFTWECTLERVGGGALPQIEVTANYAHVDPSNALSATEANVTGSTTRVAGTVIPSTAYDGYTLYFSADGTTRVAESGTLSLFSRTFPTLPVATTHVWTVVPADAYVGACSIRGTYAGVADQLCLGDMTPAVSGVVLSNGLVRAKITGSTLTIEVYDSGSWVTTSATGWTMIASSGSIGSNTIDLGAAPTVAVLRNGPESAAIRVLGAGTKELSPTGRVWIDLEVKRGSMMVTVVTKCDATASWSLASTNAVAGTSINGGVRQTSNDGNGNRLIVVGNGTARNTSNIGVSGGTAYGIGVELGGSSATDAAAAQQVAYEWFMGRSETQQVVLR